MKYRFNKMVIGKSLNNTIYRLVDKINHNLTRDTYGIDYYDLRRSGSHFLYDPLRASVCELSIEIKLHYIHNTIEDDNW